MTISVARHRSSVLSEIHVIIVIIALTCMACSSSPAVDEQSPALPTSTLQQHGLEAAFWEAAVREINDRDLPIDTMILVHGGEVVAEHYWGEHGRNTLHDLRSSTKSVTSLLVGAALKRGLLRDLDQSVIEFFPERKPHSSWASHRPLTIRDLLTMRSGLDCDDWRDSAGNEELMYWSDDWLDFFFRIPSVREPGEAFSYCTAGVVVLGEVIARVGGAPLPQLAEQWLMKPLGILSSTWAEAPNQVTDSGGHLDISVESLAKIGLVTMNGGAWAGQQLIDPDYLAEAIRPQTWIDHPTQGPQYGYLWWLEPVRDGEAKSFQTRGNGGQYAMVIPDFDVVIAFTGHAYNAEQTIKLAPFDLVQRFIIPMMQGDSFQP